MTRNVDSFVAEYFREYRALAGDAPREDRPRGEGRRRVSPSEQLSGLLVTDGDQAWTVIVALVNHAPDDDALSFVAAGPVEDFIAARGEDFGDRIAAEAIRNPRLRSALNLTWNWARVPALVRDRLWPYLEPGVRAYWAERLGADVG